MKATLRYARIAPKKASLIAALVRRQSVDAAIDILSHLPKKAAQFLRDLITSATANAAHNAKQSRHSLFVKSLTVTKGSTFRRHIPIARGRARPIDKCTSHLAVELGVLVPKGTERPFEALRGPQALNGKVQKEAKVMEVKKEKEPAETLEHVDALPVSSPPTQPPPRAGEDPHAKGFSPKHEPRGPIFQPHQRGARGA